MAKTLLQDLSSVATFKSGGTPSKQRSEYWGGELPWISGKDFRGFEASSSKDTLSAAGAAVASRVPEGSTLVLVRGMILARRVPVMYTTREVAINQDVRALVPGSEMLPRYLAYAIHARAPQLQRFVTYAGHGTGRLESDFLKSLPIWVPSLEEQQQVVEHIGRFDEALGTLRRLLKLRKVRLRGLMQQLLTGRRRVSAGGATKAMVPSSHHREIPEDWIDVELGSVVKKISRRNTVSETHVLTASGEHGLVDQREFFNRSVAGADLSGYYLLKKGDFAYNRSRMKGYEYGAIKRLDRYEQGVLSTLYLCFAISSEDVDSDFLQWYFEGGQMGRQLRRVTPVGGRAHGLLNITDGDFYSIRIMLPPLDEQRMIADILGTAQREIELLEQLREQIQLQKRGLMQKLLTGEIRVPADEPVTEEVS